MWWRCFHIPPNPVVQHYDPFFQWPWFFRQVEAVADGSNGPSSPVTRSPIGRPKKRCCHLAELDQDHDASNGGLHQQGHSAGWPHAATLDDAWAAQTMTWPSLRSSFQATAAAAILLAQGFRCHDKSHWNGQGGRPWFMRNWGTLSQKTNRFLTVGPFLLGLRMFCVPPVSQASKHGGNISLMDSSTANGRKKWNMLELCRCFCTAFSKCPSHTQKRFCDQQGEPFQLDLSLLMTPSLDVCRGVVRKHRQEMREARLEVDEFLQRNGFKVGEAGFFIKILETLKSNMSFFFLFPSHRSMSHIRESFYIFRVSVQDLYIL